MRPNNLDRGSAQNVNAVMKRGSVWMLGGRLLRTVAGVATIAILARLLTPADFGVLALCSAITILSLTVLEGAVEIPITRAERLTFDGFNTLLWIGLATLVPIILLICLVRERVEISLALPGLSLALGLTIWVMVSQVFWIAGLAVLRRKHLFSVSTIATVLTTLIYGFVSVGLVSAGFGLHGVIVGQICANMVASILLCFNIGAGFRLPNNWDKTVLLQGSGLGTLSRLITWAWTNIDTLLVSIFLGGAATGVYSRAYNLSVQVKEPFLAVDQVVRQAFASSDTALSVISTRILVLRLLTLASGFGAAVIVQFREVIVYVLLGPDWHATTDIFAVLVVGLPARVALMYFDSFSVSSGSLRSLVKRHTMLLIAIALSLLFVTSHGLVPVAMTITLSVYVTALLPSAEGDNAAFGSFAARMSALLPGMVLVLSLTAVDFASALTLELSALGSYSIRLASIALVSLGFFFLPSSWLPRSWSITRSRLIAKIKTPFRTGTI